ncbi:hypothetical protein ABDB91_18055 [Desulfoscipio sp. XC116]|uniref:hypothetical protein n=1 Tax=Desulfoscipio sp. XC116 TaxID=3144975 RepID=UPI00325ACCB4
MSVPEENLCAANITASLSLSKVELQKRLKEAQFVNEVLQALVEKRPVIVKLISHYGGWRRY